MCIRRGISSLGMISILSMGIDFVYSLPAMQERKQSTPIHQSEAKKRPDNQRPEKSDASQPPRRSSDAVHDAQTPLPGSGDRPESQKSEHDRADFSKSAPASTALNQQPDEGRMKGFDFSRDPLGASKPMQTFEESMQADVAAKPAAMQTQKQLLANRYTLEPQFHPTVTMTRGKPVPLGPTARLKEGTSWVALADMSAEEIRNSQLFPYPPLPHPLQKMGVRCFLKCRSICFRD